jgi:hypothetical protein
MVRVLRRLKINEVSSCDRGAGDGCRVVLFKRDDTVAPDNGNGDGYDDDEVYASALHYLMQTPHGAGVARRFFPRGASADDIEHLARLVAQSWRARDNNNGDDDESDLTIGDDDENDDDEIEDDESADTIGDATTEKVFPMSDRNTALQAIVKRDGGVVPLCKRICREGAGGISESELTELITEAAMREHPDLSPASAFTKAYCSPAGETLRRAISVCKGLLEPVAGGVGGSDTDDAAKAYQQLQRLAEVQKRRVPGLSMPQAFERASRDRPDLLARAVPRR